MLGHALFRAFFARPELDAHATARTLDGVERHFSPDLSRKVRVGVDADDLDSLASAFASVRPDVVVNCIGLIKQSPEAAAPLKAITLNALLPHRVAALCRDSNARLIHISTDCVFDGKKGMYTEDDVPNADDLYGQTKMLGEVREPHCVTLRTSIIGHELRSRLGLVEWFLSQTAPVRGFTKAIYSGFPTVEMARIIVDFVLPNRDLSGVYNVSSAPISKYDLLGLVARRYGKEIRIDAHDGFVLDRSLDSTRFQAKTGYRPPAWPELVDAMWRDHREHAAPAAA